MRKRFYLALLFLGLASPAFAGPRNPLPDTPSQVWQNDLDLRDMIESRISVSTSGAYCIDNPTFCIDPAANTVTITGTTLIKGTSTNDNALEGYVGEYISSCTASAINLFGSGVIGDASTISLTAGDWDVDATCQANQSGATWSFTRCGISTTSGNSSTGLSGGSTQIINAFASSATTPVTVGKAISIRASISATTSYYLKTSGTYSAGTPTFSGCLSARRMR